MKRWLGSLSLGLLCVGTLACTKKSAPAVSEMSAQQLVERGKAIYGYNCLSCHAANPSHDGTVGPAIAGSSLELIQSRVMKAQYPAGYQSKRDTQLMPAMPMLEKEIPALHAYLNSAGEKK